MPRIRIASIRTRLLVAFVLLVLLPVLVLGLAMGVGGSRGFQQQMTDHLASVAILKEAEIATWRADLQFDLVLALTGEDVMRRAIVLLERVQDPATAILAQGVVKSRFQQVMLQTGRFEELMLVALDGRVALSTDPTQTDAMVSNQSYFRQGLEGPYLQPPRLSPGLRRTSVYASRPVVNYQGEVLGVLVGRASVTKLTAIMAERTGLGLTGETYLVGSSQTLLTPTRAGVTNVWIDSQAIRRAIADRRHGSGLYENYDGQAVVGAWHWLPELEAVLVAEQQQDEAFRPVYTLLAIAAAVGLLGVLVAVGVSLRFTRGIAVPLAGLAESATRIAGGDLGDYAGLSGQAAAGARREDEIGMLARAFESMTTQLRDLIGGLEERVAERTRELGLRSRYLEAAAEVGRAAASILEVDVLVQQVVDLIRREFDLYYAGLFLVDETGEWAVLRAATGEAGKAMLARGHKLPIGGASMVGWCVANREARVAHISEMGALEAGPDVARLAAPELPETRAEAALPLRSRGQVLGAITVQHTEPDVFRPEAVVALQTLADQVAVALDNARLFAERQEALEAAQRAYGELSREAWGQLLQSRLSQEGAGGLAYRSYERGVIPYDEPLGDEARLALEYGSTVQSASPQNGDRHSLAIPIRVRGQVIGVLETYKPASAGAWSPEEVALLERIVEELDPALESARLYRDTQSRAARERAIRQVTEEMRRAVDVEAILQSTVVELARALGAPRAYVRLGTEEQLLSSARAVTAAEAGPTDGGGSQEGGEAGA
ncbi:MAG: GAF domain-containing protein [Anaerolineaceae bacterium]|nr:GAF domain-containing protein [Anaerolineaceae bacterium]